MGRDGVSIHQHHDCVLNRFFQAQLRENIKAQRHWPLCGEFTGDQWNPAQMVSNAENVFIWWRHHEIINPGHALRSIIYNGVDIFIYGSKIMKISISCDENPAYFQYLQHVGIPFKDLRKCILMR